MQDNADNNIFKFMVLRPARDGGANNGDDSLLRREARRVALGQRSGEGKFNASQLNAALRELTAVDLASNSTIGPSGRVMLNEAGVARISPAASAALFSLGLSPRDHPIEDIHRGLLAAIAGFGRPSVLPSGNSPPQGEPAKLKAVGICELLVVKQQIKRYEPGEVAYIETILAGETKSRTTRTLDRTEEDLLLVEDTQRERETENQSTERFELNRETSHTQQIDQKTGFGLSLSGRYGPSVEFKSNLDVSNSNAQTDAQTLGVKYAKEVIERSKERIVEDVRSERRVTVLREVEETTERSLDNSTGDNRSGAYQFVDKIYESQVFNYGLRQIFDFMIPEPASFLWYLEHQPNPDIEIPVAPIPLENEARSALEITEGNYAQLAARYGATGVKPPPSLFERRIAHMQVGSGGEGSEGGVPQTRVGVDIDVPDGFRPWAAIWSAMGTTDDVPTLALTVGNVNDVWRPAGAEFFDLQGDDVKLYRTLDPRFLFGTISDGFLAGGQKLSCELIGFETANHSADIMIYFTRTAEIFEQWQHDTYGAIADAYSNALLRYQQDLEVYRQRQADAAAKTVDFGDNPSLNQLIIQRELKKHCLTFIQNRQVGDPATDFPTDSPPQFDIPDALQDGRRIRFLELAFEWDQMQYVFYPYFWSREETWQARFQARNVDPQLQEFLGAGYARAVIPVRAGFEGAVGYFMETGEVFAGEGDPDINDPLYQSIVTEIEERTGAGEGEVATGDPWETRMPTSLLYVRPAGGLPSWKRDPPGEWKWVPEN